MATIVSEHAVAGGYNVNIATGGKRHTLSFPTQPTDEHRDDVIRQYEQIWTNDIAADKQVEAEEVDSDGI